MKNIISKILDIIALGIKIIVFITLIIGYFAFLDINLCLIAIGYVLIIWAFLRK